jgi:uncharacterized protein (TIGR01777 family)
MVGKALMKSFEQWNGVQVFRLVRTTPRLPNEIFWDPVDGKIDLKSMEGMDCIVHLAGENVGSGNWNDRKKHDIIESRRKGTQLISTAIASLKSKPKVLFAASGIGYYGAHPTKDLHDNTDVVSGPGDGFLAQVAQVCESSTDVAKQANIRVINARLGAVLSGEGGMIEKLKLPFLFGVGGRLGDGKQFMSWIEISDLTRAISHCLKTPELQGPVHFTAPNPCTNDDFTKAFASAVNRFAIFPLPEFVLKNIFGEMADELLLSSQKVYPDKLLPSGSRFSNPADGSPLQ